MFKPPEIVPAIAWRTAIKLRLINNNSDVWQKMSFPSHKPTEWHWSLVSIALG